LNRSITPRRKHMMEQLTATFKALSDETRLRMMALLLEKDELCVCDFVGVLRLTQSKASRHLRYLYNAGLVQDRREGLWMNYRISSKLSPAQKAIVAALSEAIEQDRKQELRQSLKEWFIRKAEQAAARENELPCCPPAA
jgi:ArsR family transcriptional regulator, arsenate/arsenite/antimonite-responsive transcriptional repressor